MDDIHNRYPYTYQVLRSLKKDYPEDELYLIMGSDNLEMLPRWQKIEEILQYKIIVFNRGEILFNSFFKKHQKQFLYLRDFPYLDISSTKVRQGDFSHIRKEVVDYMKEKKLYEDGV